MPISVRRPSIPPPSSVRSIHDELIEVLTRYVSQITVTSMLGSTLAQRSLTAADVRAGNIVELIEDLMAGLRLFCSADRLPDLMVELAEFCDRVLYASFGPPSHRSIPPPPPPPKLDASG